MFEATGPYGDTLESLVVHFLRTVPETWADHDPSSLSELHERAISLLTAAGMIERRVTLRLRMVGHPVAVEATITLTGETGLAQAMQFVLTDIWHDWRGAVEQSGSGPTSHCERLGNEQWRLTAEGVLARNDLDAGHASTVFDFVLRRGFFDGQPRLLPADRIAPHGVVAGRGALVRMRRVRSDAGPQGVAITNWEAGGLAFAAAFAELLKSKPSVPEPEPPAAGHPSFALLRVFTNAVVDERIEKAATVVIDDQLTVNEKLSTIDALIPFPPTASAEQLGEMLGVSKQAVLKTEWWKQHRRGEKDDEIGRRRAGHRERAERYEPPRSDDDER